MLIVDPAQRPSADDLLGRWLGSFEILAGLSRDLSGTVF